MVPLNKRTKKRIILWACLFVIFLSTSIGCFIVANTVRQSAYRQFVSISSATAKESRIETYLRAIRLSPHIPDAYLLLLDTFNEDGIFDATESETFLSIYNSYHSKIPVNEAGAAVYIKAGLLYINGYGDNPTTSLRMALPFFEAALPLISDNHEYYSTTVCYAKIGQYYRDYIWTSATREVTKESMETLLNEVDHTLISLTNDKGADQIYNYLGFANAVCNLLYGQRDVLAATVDLQTVNNLLDRIYIGMPEVASLQAVRTKQMAQTLYANRDMYYDMISRAYERNEGGRT